MPDLPFALQFLSPHVVSQRDEYMRAASMAREFFRSHADRRYSPASLDELSRLRGFSLGTPDPRLVLPLIATAYADSTYDEETESKSGGYYGIAVCWPNSRTVIAINRRWRRQKIGTRLISLLASNVGYSSLTLWVGRENVAGHHFALQQGMLPTALNSTGAVRYDGGAMDDL